MFFPHQHHTIHHMLYRQHHYLHLPQHHVLLFNLYNFIAFFHRQKPIIMHHLHRWLHSILDRFYHHYGLKKKPFNVYARMRVCVYLLLCFLARYFGLFVVSFISSHFFFLYLSSSFLCMFVCVYVWWLIFFLLLCFPFNIEKKNKRDTRYYFG